MTCGLRRPRQWTPGGIVRGARALALAVLFTAGLGAAPAWSATASLQLSPATASFPAANPDTTPSIGATENPVGVTVSVNGGPGLVAQLTALASGNLVSGPDSIPVNQIRWTATGSGFVAGILSKDTTQLVGQWVGKTSVVGQLSFWLANSWSYPTGSYNQTVVYTLVAT